MEPNPQTESRWLISYKARTFIAVADKALEVIGMYDAAHDELIREKLMQQAKNALEDALALINNRL